MFIKVTDFFFPVESFHQNSLKHDNIDRSTVPVYLTFLTGLKIQDDVLLKGNLGVNGTTISSTK